MMLIEKDVVPVVKGKGKQMADRRCLYAVLNDQMGLRTDKPALGRTEAGQPERVAWRHALPYSKNAITCADNMRRTSSLVED
jgi:hypothetical protein